MINGVGVHGWNVDWLGEQAGSQPASWVPKCLNVYVLALGSQISHKVPQFAYLRLELLQLMSDALHFQQSKEHLHKSDLLAFSIPNGSNSLTFFSKPASFPPFPISDSYTIFPVLTPAPPPDNV